MKTENQQLPESEIMKIIPSPSPNFNVNNIGRMYGGGNYIVNYNFQQPREDGSLKNRCLTVKFTLADHWNDIRDRKKDEDGNPLEETEEPQFFEERPRPVSQTISEVIKDTLPQILETVAAVKGLMGGNGAGGKR